MLDARMSFFCNKFVYFFLHLILILRVSEGESETEKRGRRETVEKKNLVDGNKSLEVSLFNTDEKMSFFRYFP